MTTPLTITEPVELTQHRCYQCGRWWAYERFAASMPDCPVCSQRVIDRQRTSIEERDRTIVGLRGALTKARKRGR